MRRCDSSKDESPKPVLRLMLAKNDAPHSPMIFNSVTWVCSCMQGKRAQNKAALQLEAINIWRLLHSSPESNARKGDYSVRLPYLVRLATKKAGEQDTRSNKFFGNLLKFEENHSVEISPGLYSCKIYVKLSNHTWRLSLSECAFIEGRGPCAVTVYLSDFACMGPIPPSPSIFREFGYAVRAWALSYLNSDSAQKQSILDASRASP
jgi:hypothetical protein